MWSYNHSTQQGGEGEEKEKVESLIWQILNPTIRATVRITESTFLTVCQVVMMLPQQKYQALKLH